MIIDGYKLWEAELDKRQNMIVIDILGRIARLLGMTASGKTLSRDEMLEIAGNDRWLEVVLQGFCYAMESKDYSGYIHEKVREHLKMAAVTEDRA